VKRRTNKNPPDSVEAARDAGLRYTSDTKPGMRRVKRGAGFSYRFPDGRAVRDHNELIRIKRLAIPPAWTDVWICPFESGHLQATGRDQRGRKQYRYHERWRETRDATKYGHIMDFAKALPKIRRHVGRDLKLPGLPREKVLATVVRLLEKTLIRVGNDEYARANKSYGLTTMRNRHVEVKGTAVSFEFRGKSGKSHKIDVRDPQLAKIVKRCQDLPGQELFEYVGEDGKPQTISSGEVNEYLQNIAGAEYTAKDFRTWAGTVLAALALKEFEKFASQRQAKKNITQAIEAVARVLGNTPAICRKCYVHPGIVESYMDGSMLSAIKQRANRQLRKSVAGLKYGEALVILLLKQQLKQTRAHRKLT
jgi:DNA topoisomerase-1